MTIITAIRSFFTPTKVYKTANATISKELQRDGSTLTRVVGSDGSQIKAIVKTPFDRFVYSPDSGNLLFEGHRTTVYNYKDLTKTVIVKYDMKTEKPIYNGLDHNNILIDAGGKYHRFQKTTKKGDIFQGCSTHITEYSRFKQIVKILYDKSGNVVSAKKAEVKC